MTQEKKFKIFTHQQSQELIQQEVHTDAEMSPGRTTYRAVFLSDEKPDGNTADHVVADAKNARIWLDLEKKPPQPPRRTIVRAPGSQSAEILKLLYTKNTFERVFSQIVLDMREEHAEALFQGQTRQASWIHVRGVLTLLATVFIHAATSIGKTAVRIWKLTP